MSNWNQALAEVLSVLVAPIDEERAAELGAYLLAAKKKLDGLFPEDWGQRLLEPQETSFDLGKAAHDIQAMTHAAQGCKGLADHYRIEALIEDKSALQLVELLSELQQVVRQRLDKDDAVYAAALEELQVLKAAATCDCGSPRNPGHCSSLMCVRDD